MVSLFDFAYEHVGGKRREETEGEKGEGREEMLIGIGARSFWR